MLHDSMSKLLQACIAFSGDVDTVATIALAAGSCSREIAQDLPENLVQGLENQSYGRDYIRELDRQLMNCRSDFWPKASRIQAPGFIPKADSGPGK